MGAAEQRRMRRIDAVAKELGFPTASSLRKWCTRNRVDIYMNGRLALVDFDEILAKFSVPVVPRKITKADDLDDVIDGVLARRH